MLYAEYHTLCVSVHRNESDSSFIKNGSSARNVNGFKNKLELEIKQIDLRRPSAKSNQV